MYGYNFTDDDQFLSFAGISVLVFNADGEISSLKPVNGSFCGWEASNYYSFNLQEHFLKPNQLSWEAFKKQIQFDAEVETEYIWHKPCGTATRPLATFWKHRQDVDDQTVVCGLR